MNIFNILRRKLGLVTVPELQKVSTAIVNSIPAVPVPDYEEYVATLSLTLADGIQANVLSNTFSGAITPSYNSGAGELRFSVAGGFDKTKTVVFFSEPVYGANLTKLLATVDPTTSQVTITRRSDSNFGFAFTSANTGLFSIIIRRYNN